MNMKYIMCLFFASLTLFSCEMKKELFGQTDKDKIDNSTSENDGLLDLELKPIGEVNIPDSKGDNITGGDIVTLDVNGFAVDVFDDKDNLVKHYQSYADFKNEGGLLLPAGNYSIRATMGDDVSAGFDKPYYSGSQVCEITPQEVAKVITECVLSNKKVTFRCTDEFLKKFKDDYSIVVDNNLGVITTSKDETRALYLKNTGILQFTIYTTTVEGSKHLVYNYDLSKNDQVMEYNNILIDLDLVEEPTEPEIPVDPEEPTDPGDPVLPPTDTVIVKTPAIKVDISLIEKDFIIEIPSDFIESGGDGGNENPGGGEDPKPAKPTIVGDEGLDISKPIEVSGAGNKTVRVTITTPGKLASLQVKIISPILEPLVEALGLGSEFDMCNLSATQSAIIDQLGLAKPTVGAASNVFDISAFMPMIAGLEAGDYIFKITAVDEIGQKDTKTLTIRNLNQ